MGDINERIEKLKREAPAPSSGKMIDRRSLPAIAVANCETSKNDPPEDLFGMLSGSMRFRGGVDYEYVPSLGPRASLAIWRMAPRW
jgi:hypothetical protein